MLLIKYILLIWLTEKRLIFLYYNDNDLQFKYSNNINDKEKIKKFLDVLSKSLN